MSVSSIARLRAETERLRHTNEFELDQLIQIATEEIYTSMAARGVTKSELAERLGTSRGYVTKLLDGQENMTLKTLVRVANALEMKVDVRLKPRQPLRAKTSGKRTPAARSRRRAGASGKRAVRTTGAVAARSRKR